MTPGSPGATAVFAHAVASFDPDETRVILWTRLSGGPTRATLVVGRDRSLLDVVHRSEHDTGSDTDHTVAVDVDGLEPGTSYWYRFEAGGEHSPVGRTRTLPAAPPGRPGPLVLPRLRPAPQAPPEPRG